jgi:sugar phosphate isomerase/epimerase
VNTLSINQATTETSSTLDLLEACAAAGVTSVAPWRHKYLHDSATLTRQALDDHGLKATSLCRGGFFTGTRPDSEAEADNLRAVEEAATLGAPVLVLVCGPVTSHGGLAAAETAILRGLERLLSHAQEHDVTLALEPFHPMFAAERSAVVTLGQATRLVRNVLATDAPTSAQQPVRTYEAGLGIAVDTYHVWWDPTLEASLAQAADLITAVHVADWLLPTTELLAGRGLPGDGVIDLHGLLQHVQNLGYEGPFEVEVLNRAVWERDPAELVTDIRTRMLELLAPEEVE